MDEERVVKLLEEIRDLQRLHVDNYKQALDNQRESIEFNRQWQRKMSRRQLFGLVLLLVVVALFWLATFVTRR